MAAVFSQLPPSCRLPPDILSASWSWQWKPRYEVHGVSGLVGTGPTHRYLDCCAAFANLDEISDLVVKARESHCGEQVASATFRCRRLICGFDRDLTARTSLGDLVLRTTSARDFLAGMGECGAHVEPSSVVALVERLEDYVGKWRRGEYVEF